MPSSTSNSEVAGRRLPVALLVTLALFALTEQAAWRTRPWLDLCALYASPFRAADPLRTAAQIRLLDASLSAPPIVLAGSSQVQEGLDCAAVERRLPGRPCINIGISAGTPLDTLFLVGLLERSAPRHTLVLGVFPQVLHREPKAAFTDASTLRCLYRSGSLFRMTPAEWVDDVFYGVVQDLSETLRMKDSLRDMWDVVGPDPAGAIRHSLPPQPRRALEGLEPRGPEFFRQLMSVVDPTIAPGRFTPAHETALDEIIARELKRGNTTIILDFPTRRGYETTITPEARVHYRGLVDRLAARQGVHFVRREELPPLLDRDFQDFTHMRASGRAKVSARVADLLVEVGG
jgi:hypothetical protein